MDQLLKMENVSVNNLVSEFNKFYAKAVKNSDPRTTDFFLVWNDPRYVIALATVYILFIFFGRRYMETREAFNVPYWLIAGYNFALTGLSIYMFEEIIVGAYRSNYSWWCAPYNRSTSKSEMKIVNALWWYFFSKAIEFMDTVWMILRKKFVQVTFLHVFHHSTMLLIWWVVVGWIPSGFSCFGAAINSGVHIIMYFYYALSIIPSMKQTLWWKKYITKIQLGQFIFCLCHTFYGIYYQCDYPKWAMNMLAVYMVIMLILFSNFYIHEYINKSNDKKRAGGAITKSSKPKHTKEN